MVKYLFRFAHLILAFLGVALIYILPIPPSPKTPSIHQHTIQCRRVGRRRLVYLWRWNGRDKSIVLQGRLTSNRRPR